MAQVNANKKKTITPEEFRRLAKTTDWSDYNQKVLSKMTEIVQKYEKAQLRSLARASRRVCR